MKLAPYPEYKDSGVPWLRKIPAHWNTKRLKYLFQEKDLRSTTGNELLLSMTRSRGLIPQTEISIKNPSPENLIGYKICDSGEIVMNRMQAWSGMFYRAANKGLVSPDYVVFKEKNDLSTEFFEKYFRTPKFVAECRVRSTGIGTGFNRLYGEDFGRIYVTVPSKKEQIQIARFLDWKTAHINKFIRNKRRLIELLKEQKQNIINQAVTRGIDPDVKLKPSGVEWIGDIPEHWEERKLKHISAMKSGDNLTSNQIGETGDYPVYGGNGLRGYFNSYNKDGRYLLVGRQGALCGNVHRVEGKFWATEHAVVTAVTPEISIDWCYYMLTVMNLNQYSESAAQPGISVEKIQNLRTALPSFDEQEAIVSHIELETVTIHQTIARAEREIELMREYRTRLISDVVTGQVDVRGVEVPDVAGDDLAALDESDDGFEESEIPEVEENIEE